VLTISSGYDPLYLTRSVATGRENYYLSAVAEHGEPPGIWTGRGCPELGLRPGAEVNNKVMERLYGAFLDPRDPAGEATLGRALQVLYDHSILTLHTGDDIEELHASQFHAPNGVAPTAGLMWASCGPVSH